MTLKSHEESEEKLTCGLENETRNWTNFTRTLESVKIGAFTGYFYPKQKIYVLKNYRGVMCYDNEELCKI